MKIKFSYLIVLLSLLAFSCVRDYDGPPLLEPSYDKDANMTIAQLKERYKDISDVTIIEYEFIVNARIVGNDESGNIYKQLYIEDATGGIAIGIDQNSIYASLRVGQEVYLELHNLYILKYGGELQIGYGDTNANRIPWNIFVDHVHLQGFPDVEKVKPAIVTIKQLSDAYVHTLVRFDNVSFQNAEEGTTFVVGETTTEQPIVDSDGASLAVRTSAYANFGTDSVPKGNGSVVGIISRYNGSWQLTIRDMNDLINFGSSSGGNNGGNNGGGDGGDESVFFKETFGNGDYPSGSRPKLVDFNDWDMKAPIVYSDQYNYADIRSTGSINPHIWFPATAASQLMIEGIDQLGQYKDIVLSYDIATNSVDVATNTNHMIVKVNGVQVTTLDYTFTATNAYKNVEINIGDNIQTIEFYGDPAINLAGYRVDNITLKGTKE